MVENRIHQFLRITALVGIIIVILLRSVQLYYPILMRSNEVQIFFLSLIFAGLALRFLLKEETKLVFKHLDLLVPLCLFVTAATILDKLFETEIFSFANNPFYVFDLSFLQLSISLKLILNILLNLMYIGWTTGLIVNVLNQKNNNLISALVSLPKRFLRIIIGVVFCWLGVIIIGIISYYLSTYSSFILVFFAGLSVLCWNLATSLIIPLLFFKKCSILQSIFQSFKLGWKYWHRFSGIIIVQMLLLGWITVLPITMAKKTIPSPIYISSYVAMRVNVFWTGGYEDKSEWFRDVEQNLNNENSMFVSFLLSLFLAIFAIVVKIYIVKKLQSIPLPEKDFLDQLPK